LDSQVRGYLDELISEVERYPSDPDRRKNLGLAYAANGLWSEARETFLGLKSMVPQQPLAPMYAAVALQELSDEAGAWREFLQVTSNFPAFAPGWYRVGEAALRRGDHPKVEQAFERLMALAPREWRGPAGLGELRLSQGRLEEAQLLLEKAIHMDFSAKPAHYLLGQVYRNLGRTNEAQLALDLGSGENRLPMPDEWSEEAPSHMRLLPDQLAQAEELSERGQPEQAVQLLRRALPFHGEQPELLNGLAIASNRAGQSIEALGYVNRALQADPKSVAALVTRALVQARLGRFDAGRMDAEEALRLAPCLTQAHLAMAELWLSQDADRKAISALEDALRCDPKNADIHVEIGDILWHNLGEKGSAMKHYRSAVSIHPAHAHAWSCLGQLQWETGDSIAARQTHEQLIRIAPGGRELAELESAMKAP
jgi:tetratricopeptide (TPR) repeat protein